MYFFDLLVNMCRGRSGNCMAIVEESGMSYRLLMNLAMNRRLPRELRARAINLVLVLYVDNFPSQTNCGAAHLPEKIWVLEDSQELFPSENKSRPNKAGGSGGDMPQFPAIDSRMRTVSIIPKNLKPGNEDAFRVFAVPPSSSAFGNSVSEVGFSDHCKHTRLTHPLDWLVAVEKNSLADWTHSPLTCATSNPHTYDQTNSSC